MLSSTRQVTLLSILATLCIVVQLTPRPPNVELTSFIVFLVGAVFGIPLGVGLGALVMFINGFFSSYGFAGLVLPFQVTGIVIVGVGGGLYGRRKRGVYGAGSVFETAMLGAFLTLVYDVITNVGVAMWYVLAETPVLLAIVIALTSGALFSLIHVVSNAIVFAALFFPLTNTLHKLLRCEDIWKKEPLLT